MKRAAAHANRAARNFSSSAPVLQQASRASVFALLLPCAAAAGLGVWQLQRREWKAEQLQQRAKQLAADPLPLAALAATPAGEWRRVECRGELSHAKAQFVGPRVRTLGGVTRTGFLLVEPLVAADGTPVLLNRGWVPAEWRVRRVTLPRHPRLKRLQTNPPPSAANPSCVAVTGVVRASENPSSFVPDNAGGDWFWLDVPALAVAAGLPPTTPLVEVVVPGGAPQVFPMPQEEGALLRFSVMPNDHRNYAATWLTLAAACGVIAGRAVRTRNAGAGVSLARKAAAARHKL